MGGQQANVDSGRHDRRMGTAITVIYIDFADSITDLASFFGNYVKFYDYPVNV